MFLRLRHPGIVGGNDEKREIDRADACHHVVDKIGVSRDVDHAELEGVVAFAGKGKVGKAELNSNASFFFLRQTIWIGAGEGLDQGRLAVVDMAGGADDEMLSGHGWALRGYF